MPYSYVPPGQEPKEKGNLYGKVVLLLVMAVSLHYTIDYVLKKYDERVFERERTEMLKEFSGIEKHDR